MTAKYDAVIVGAGPNGLSAGLTLQRSGLSTVVIEASERAGGGAITSALTLPGFRHDDCSAVHPLAVASPLFQTLELGLDGLRWIDSPAPLAHVIDEDHCVTMERAVDATAAQLGRDAENYRALFTPFVEHFKELIAMVLGPVRWPAHPVLMARFGREAVRSLRGLAGSWFQDAPAAALLAGIASHALVPLDAAPSASFALILGTAAHAVGWPIALGGSQAISDALVAQYRRMGGELVLSHPIQNLGELPDARAYLLDTSPEQLRTIAGELLPASYLRRLARFRHGPGSYKVDWALSAPIPWREPSCARAATVHLSGTLGQLAVSEHQSLLGQNFRDPFILLVQPSLFDATRAPSGMHTAWAYCHVPFSARAPEGAARLGFEFNQCAAIEAHIERFAPGFGKLILARSTRNPRDLERHNPNLVGGDISAGLPTLTQLFFRPVARMDPYATPHPRIFLCSASTPPGPGVHGMCGYWAAQSALAALQRTPRTALLRSRA